jgi:superfamily II DNA or RNA helicase/intein/homing endonuclease
VTDSADLDAVSLDAFHDVLEDADRPVVTASEVAQTLDCTQAEAVDALAALADEADVERLDVESDPVVWFPTDWAALADRERVVLFPERREIVVDNPTQFTRAQLSQFAHLADTNGEAGYVYELRREDIWQAPYDSLTDLLQTVRQVVPESSSHVEAWIEDQWKRAHQFTLRTHEDGYVVLEAASDDLMGNVARQKLDDDQLRAPIDDDVSWVAEGSVAEVKRILYEAGYPVQDERDLDEGDALDIDLDVELRGHQKEWVREFTDVKSGVLVGPPGSGKTVAAIGVLEAVGGETLILVPSRELASQWRDELLGRTTLTADQIGEYHGGEKQIRPVTIATYQTAGMDRHRQLFDERRWGLIVYDEVHHVPATVYRRSTNLQTNHRLGMSVDGDTVLPIKRGESVSMERIEDIASKYLDDEVGRKHVDGIKTLGVTSEGKVVWTDVTAVMRHEHGGPMYTIRSRNGRKISVTKDHSLIVFDKKESRIVSKPPSELSDGDYLLQPATDAMGTEGKTHVDILDLLEEGYVLLSEDIPEEALDPLYEQGVGDNKSRYNWKSRGNLPLWAARRIDLDRQYIKGVYVHKREKYIPPTVSIDHFARLVGLFVADGVLGDSRVEFYATDSDEESEVGAFKKCIRTLHPKADITTVSNGNNCATVRISGPLAAIFENIGLSNGAREKHIPSSILSNPAAYEPFIEGIILGDGHIQERGGGKRITTISTSSHRLSQGLNFVLSSLGHVGGTYRRISDVQVRDGEHDVTTNYLVRFNPNNRTITGRNAMVPFSASLRACYEEIERLDPPDRPASTLQHTLDSGLDHRTRLNSDEIRTLVERSGKTEHEWLAETDIAMLEVESITETAPEKYVYDVSTDEENFLGNHLFCHNSATPIREDDREKDIFTLIGPPIGTDWDSLFDAGFVQEPEVEIRYVPWATDERQQEHANSGGHDRRQIAATNPAKLREVRHLLATHRDAKALVFVEYLDHGEALAEALNVPFLSGETRHARREKLLSEFRHGQRDTLVISRVGDEGIDLPDADLVLVASGLGGSRRQGAQRAGRTMRPAGNALVYVLATRGTTEEEYAKRQVQHLSTKGIRVREQDAETID